MLERPRGTTRALILAPTRELTAQIAEHLTALAKHTDVTVAAVYGGVGFGPQVKRLRAAPTSSSRRRAGCSITSSRRTARLDDISMLVLDEADRMLDMGFLPAVRRILRYIAPNRQTLFFSATIAARDLGADAARCCTIPRRSIWQPKPRPPSDVDADASTPFRKRRKTDLLLELLKDNSIYSAIAFTRTKARANRLAARIWRSTDVPPSRIHGDRSQAQRTRALDDFKRGKYRVLVATDIAARGIDIAELGTSSTSTCRWSAEDYIHRVGRTARAKATGDAITFVSSDEEPLIKQIEYILGKRLERTRNPLFPEASIEPPKPRVVYRSRPRRR